jgi:hypothetical protein
MKDTIEIIIASLVKQGRSVDRSKVEEIVKNGLNGIPSNTVLMSRGNEEMVWISGKLAMVNVETKETKEIPFAGKETSLLGLYAGKVACKMINVGV